MKRRAGGRSRSGAARGGHRRAPSADAGADAERRRWFYTPTDHGGLTLGAQRQAQQRLAHRLVASGLSAAGYVTVATIVGLDNVLDRVEGWSVDWGRERGRDPGMYYLRVFGEPGGAAPWGWRFGGHHVSLNNLDRRRRGPRGDAMLPGRRPGGLPAARLRAAAPAGRGRGPGPGAGPVAGSGPGGPGHPAGPGTLGHRGRQPVPARRGGPDDVPARAVAQPFTEPELAGRIARMDAASSRAPATTTATTSGSR